MQLKKHTNTTQSLTSLFPIHSVSIILDKSFEFVNQLEIKTLLIQSQLL